jgi:hypothetical protein
MTKSDLICNPRSQIVFSIKYFQPPLRLQYIQESYTGWDSKARLCWKLVESRSPHWEHTDSIMAAGNSMVKRNSKECTIKIPTNQIKIIHNRLATYGTTQS